MLWWIEEYDRFCRIREVPYDFDGFDELKGYLISAGARQVRVLADQQGHKAPLVVHRGPVGQLRSADLPAKGPQGYRISII